MNKLRRLMLLCTFAGMSVSCMPRLNPSPAPTPLVAVSPTPLLADTPAAPPVPTATPSPVPLPAATATPFPPLYPLGGIEIHAAADIPLAAEAGAYWLRRNALVWAEIEPEEGQRRWEAVADLEQELQAAAARGLPLILIVRGVPSWAQALPGVSCGPVAPEKLEAFARFLSDAVKRYSQPPFAVHDWELSNEPDIDPQYVPPDNFYGCWGMQGDPTYGGGRYAEMLKAVYPQIQAADPQAQVLVGGLLLDCDPVSPPETKPGSGELKDCSPARFLEGVLANGGGPYFDGVSFHAYDYYNGKPGRFGNSNWHSAWNTTGPSLVAKSRYLRALLTAYGFPGKALLNTESALLCGRDGSEEMCHTPEFAATKAAYLVKAMTLAQAEGLRANLWYSLPGWRASGLLDDGQPNLAYQAFRFAAGRLQAAAFWGERTDYPGVNVYVFQREGKWVWVVWSRSEDAQTLQLSSPPVAVYGIAGEALPAGGTLTVTGSPLYLEW